MAAAAAAVVEDLDRHSLGGGGNSGAEGAFHAAAHGGDNDALAGDAKRLPDRIGSYVGDVPFGALDFRPLNSLDRTRQVMYALGRISATSGQAASANIASISPVTARPLKTQKTA